MQRPSPIFRSVQFFICEIFGEMFYLNLGSLIWSPLRGSNMTAVNSWFCNHVTGQPCKGQYNRIFSRRIYMKMEFSFQRREMLSFLTSNSCRLEKLINIKVILFEIQGLFRWQNPSQ